MNQDTLIEVFNTLGVKEPAKLGHSDEEELRYTQAAAKYENNRREIQNILNKAIKTRSQTIKQLNMAFFIIIAVIIISIILQFIIKGSNIVLFVQTACIAVLFPVSSKIEKNMTTQAYVEFVSAFLPDLEPKEAIKAIDQLYNAINNPKSIKGATATLQAA